MPVVTWVSRSLQLFHTPFSSRSQQYPNVSRNNFLYLISVGESYTTRCALGILQSSTPGDKKENAQVENHVSSSIRYFSEGLKDCIKLLHIKFACFNACRCVWLVLGLLRKIFLTNCKVKLLRQHVNRKDFQGNSQWKAEDRRVKYG